MIKIQSITDIITNSSSEVFTIYTREGVQLFKDLVSKIIGKNFDDLFEIKYLIDDSAYESFEEDNEGYDDVVDFAMAYDEDSCEGSPYVEGFDVIAKDPSNKEIAECLSLICNIFGSEERYC